MQKLSVKLKNTPRNASQVSCSVNLLLNKEKILSVTDKVRTDNNPDVNQRSTNNQDLQSKVFVLSLDGKPLMPTKPSRSRKMLLSGKAVVVKRFPFTIQLNFECENQIQEINLGIDTGYGNIGFSATTEKQELISGTLVLDGRTKERLDERRMYRKGRRNKLWYRKPRFMNRVSTKKEGWLAPSVKRRYKTHLNLINKIKKILPVTNVILEIAKFDIQKLENLSISGVDYQQGNLYDYQNLVSYLKDRQKNICPFCKKEFKSGDKKNIHHIYQHGDKKRSDRPEGLVLLHKECHINLHKNHQEKVLQNIKVNQHKDSMFMNIINKKFWQDIPNLKVTYGNITYVNRNKLGLEKTHYNDAFVISGGNNKKRISPVTWIQKHRNNRAIQLNRKGFKPSIKRDKSKVNPGDLFWIGKRSYICKGMFGNGKYICYGLTKNKEYFKFSDVTKIFKFGSLAIHPSAKAKGLLVKIR